MHRSAAALFIQADGRGLANAPNRTVAEISEKDETECSMAIVRN
jgi:hypothetical protein